ncbi:glycoside hydrolase family 97 catalytic domain-containing protein [Spirilliplanes yamanashiensis]|uniref:Alpha-glucosidase n=1 Tax=Spirilliplanes yamanashiensis TaxID=42233 RepID=A0A8J3Y605_9ACTN|nr:glycoside hydrolase family 97 catalytic domain-containing protein [Spirilliplanes yamanashiensis]MDP9819232.1 hypothetical protein [Spirilliplanes yamanashiensis]GIJ01945.1 alpha-glucosidase [Spirilliplanes yamanashiensis]
MPVSRILFAPALAAALAAPSAAPSAVPSAGADIAPTSWTVPAPGAAVVADVALTAAGTITVGVRQGGATVLAPSPVGLVTGGDDLTAGLSYLGRSGRTVRQRYTMTTGKQLDRDTLQTESTFSFAAAGGTRLDLVVRVSAQGAAYRYVLPGPQSVVVKGEASSWALPPDATGWLLPYTPNYEATRIETTAAGAPAGDYGFPALFEVAGRYALLTEADLDGRYSGGRLTHAAGSGTYTVGLADAEVEVAGGFASPWRVAVVGDLAAVTASTLVDDLAPPSRLPDTGWVRPGAVAWSWMAEHASPRDPARMREYVDFAARHRWPYVLVDEGWDRSWVPELVAYARERGVGIILWFHWTALDPPAERDETLPMIRDWGVAGVKVDFMDSDSQATMRWYDGILRATADNRLMVNFHGATVPRGMARTWPHVLTFEAVRGAEQFTTRAATNTMFPFTRNVVGSMDYTPAAFLVADRDTTDAHEVATWLVFESGWQHTADRPEAYEARPQALLTMTELPTVWHETRLLSGRPGVEAVLARRHGDRWYAGGIFARAAHTYPAGLGFLGEGRFLAETLRDGPDGLLRETRVVRRTDTLAVPVAANGGFVTAFCPYTEGLTSCDRAGRARPAGTPWVSDLPFVAAAGGWGPVERDRSNGERAAGDGGPLSIRFRTFGKGLGMHADGQASVWLGGGCTRFDAHIGIDDEVPEPGTAEFRVYGDGRLLATSGRVHSWDALRSITADTTGVNVLTLRATDAGDGINFDHADWAEARLTC